jgi:IclR family acetate operon transcriptional repressor
VTTPTGTQAVDRAARLLTEIVDAPEAVTFSELSGATGLAKSTTSRLLFALERNGLIRRESAGGYRPGDVFVRYAWRAGRAPDLVEVARPFLERLGEATSETVNLGVLNHGAVEQIAQVDSHYVLGGANWFGRSLPLHCTAQGKILLAYRASPLPAGRLERLTQATITSRAALLAELDEVRRRGFAVTVEELEPGLVAVASPVHLETGTVVAAISVSGPVTRLGPSRLSEVAAACVDQAAALSAALGFRVGREGAA